MLNVLFIIGLIISLGMYIWSLYDWYDFKEKIIYIPLTILLIIVVLGMFVMMKGLMQKREFI